MANYYALFGIYSFNVIFSYQLRYLVTFGPTAQAPRRVPFDTESPILMDLVLCSHLLFSHVNWENFKFWFFCNVSVKW